MANNKPRTDEFKANLSKRMKGVPKTLEQRVAMSHAAINKPKSPAHCEAISKALKGTPKSEEHKAALKAAWAAKRAAKLISPK